MPDSCGVPVVCDAVDGAKALGGLLVDGAKALGGLLVDGAKALVGVPKAAVDAASAAEKTVSFMSDPFGNIFQSLQSGALGLAREVLPALSRATMPDLSVSWWLNAYEVSFALGVFVMVVLLFPGVLSVARGRSSGRELFEQFVVYVPLFLVGAMFGPAAGMVLVRFFGALTDAVVSWGAAATADQVVAALTKLLGDGDPGSIAGGAVVGIFFMLLMLIGLLLVVLMLVIQLVTLYFTGVLFPLGWVWIVHRPTRGFGYKIVFVWLGVLAAHPLLFLVLGVVYSMVAAQISVFRDAPTLQRVVSLAVAALAMLVAGTAPFTLLKLAPVLPFGGNTDGPSVGGGGEVEVIGARSLNEFVDRNQASFSDASASGSSGSVSSGGGGAGPPGGGSPAGGAASGRDPEDVPLGASGLGRSGPESGAGLKDVSGGVSSSPGPGASGPDRTDPVPGAGSDSGPGPSAAGSSAAEGPAGGAAGRPGRESGAGGAVPFGVALGAAAAGHVVDAAQGAMETAAGDVEGVDGEGVLEDRP